MCRGTSVGFQQEIQEPPIRLQDAAQAPGAEEPRARPPCACQRVGTAKTAGEACWHCQQ